MNTFFLCLAAACFVGYAWATGPSCECGLYSPVKKTHIDRLPLVVYSNCAPENTSCTCEQRASACMDECYNDAVIPRPFTTRLTWRNSACSSEQRLINFPGEKLVAGASLSFVDDCSNSETQYKTIQRDPLCCRLAFVGYISMNCM